MILYHVTPAKNVKSIQKYGLDIDEAAIYGWTDFTHPGQIQMTEAEYLPAILFIDLPEHYRMRPLPNGKHLRVFKVDATGIDLEKVPEDYGPAYTTSEIIPPERLTLLEAHQLPPLTKRISRPQPFTFKITLKDPDTMPRALEELEEAEDAYGPFTEESYTEKTITLTVRNKGQALAFKTWVGENEPFGYDPDPRKDAYKMTVTPRLTLPKALGG
jgi:hypothetical protein